MTHQATRDRAFNTTRRQRAAAALALSAGAILAASSAASAAVASTTGACVQSHLVHYDTVGNGSGPTLSGGATFSENIVGLVPINNNLPVVGRPLDATDGAFGAAGTTYPGAGSNGRGIELLSGDALAFNAASPTTLGFTFGGDGFDEVRVLTNCDLPPADVPEVPFDVLLPLAGLGVVGVVATRRRHIAAR